MYKMKHCFKHVLAAGIGLLLTLTMPQSVSAVATPFPIAWQQSEEAGAEIQRTAYISQEQSWCNYPWNRGTETDNTIGLAGCSLFSVINNVYYHTGRFISPVMLADFALAEGYRRVGVEGVDIEFFSGFSDTYGAEYGISFERMTWYAETTLEHVRNGGVASANVYGHWISIADYDAETNCYLILDSSNTSRRCANIEWLDRENGIAWLTEAQLMEKGKSGYYGIDQRASALFTIDYVPYVEQGDANGDMKVDITDASHIMAYITQSASGQTPDPLHPHPAVAVLCNYAADMDSDGELTLTDATLLLEQYAYLACDTSPDDVPDTPVIPDNIVAVG